MGKTFDSYVRTCKRCNEFFRASSSGCNICDNCNMNKSRWLNDLFEKQKNLKGGK